MVILANSALYILRCPWWSHFRNFVQPGTLPDSSILSDTIVSVILLFKLHGDIAAASFNTSSLQLLLAHLILGCELLNDLLVVNRHSFSVLRVKGDLSVFAG